LSIATIREPDNREGLAMNAALRFLFLLALTVSPAAQGQLLLPAAGGPGREAERLADRLTAGDFAALEARFDDKMKAALPTGALEKTWATITEQLGRFRSRDTATARTVSGSQVGEVAANFEKGSVILRFAFDDAGRLAGFRVLPPGQPASPASGPPRLPPYARPGAFAETEVRAGATAWPLPATLTRPSGPGPFPAVVLVHGSGPNDRDETVGGTKVFRDLAAGLGSRGIVVLRYEKRSRVYAQKLAAEPDATTLASEVIDDAAAAVALLRRTPSVDAQRIVVVGHSLGAMVLPRVAAASPGLAGVAGLATGARTIDRMMLAQTDYLLRSAGLTGERLARELAPVEAEVARIRRLAAGGAEAPVMGAGAAYWRELLALDPVKEFATVAVPILLIQGERDYQVTMEDFDALRSALPRRPDATAKSYPRLNHLLVAGDGPSLPAEYEKAGFVAADVVDDLASFVAARGTAR
jgi:dienelactone hydrolase